MGKALRPLLGLFLAWMAIAPAVASGHLALHLDDGLADDGNLCAIVHLAERDNDILPGGEAPVPPRPGAERFPNAADERPRPFEQRRASSIRAPPAA